VEQLLRKGKSTSMWYEIALLERNHQIDNLDNPEHTTGLDATSSL